MTRSSSGRVAMERAGTLVPIEGNWRLDGQVVDAGTMLQMEVITHSQWDHEGRETIIASVWIPCRIEFAPPDGVDIHYANACLHNGRVVVAHIPIVGARDFSRVPVSPRTRLAWPQEGGR